MEAAAPESRATLRPQGGDGHRSRRTARRGPVTAPIDGRPSPTEKLRYEIDLLDARDVRQGD